jgi:S1-C subfamily serine protease
MARRAVHRAPCSVEPVRRTLLTTAAVLVAGALVAACGSTDSGVQVAGPGSSAPDTTITTTTPGPTSELGGSTTTDVSGSALTGREVLSRIGPSMAFVETPYGTGSGMVVDERYVLTNFHVVEPFALASVTIGGSDRHEAVPVAGIDVRRDLALLGPVDTEAPSLTLQSTEGLQAGDDLYLVGYPGEIAATPEPTISRGILSRIREEPEWGLTYIQTDAAIEGGQSGGALVDGGGRVVGISGLSSYGGNFALALAGDELQAAVDELAAGGGDSYRAIPEGGTETSGTISLVGADGEQAAVLQNGPDDVTWRLTLDPAAQPRVWIIDDFGTPLYVSDSWIAEQAAVAGVSVEEYRSQMGYDPGGSREVEPGVYDVAVPAGTFAIAFVGTTSAEPVSMAWTSSVPLFVPPDDDDTRTVQVGESVEGVVEYVESYDIVTVDLVAGEPVDIWVGSPLGDPAIEVAGPGQPMSEAAWDDDSGGGVDGLDAELTYTPTASGPHRIRIASNDGYTMFWQLKVEPA